MSHPLFGPEFRLMLEEDNTEGLRTYCENLHPATVAEVLADEEFSVEDCWRVLESTDIANQAAIFEYLPIEFQVRMAGETGRPHMARLIEQMSHDDRSNLLRRLSPRTTEQILRLVDEADRREIATSLTYEEDTVGALMTTDYAWLPETLPVSVALDRLRQMAPDRETIYYIYVLDERNRRLLGVVTLRDLVLAARHRLLRDLMETDIVTLAPGDDRESAAEHLARYDLLALPVVDEQRRLLGIVTHDDVIDVIREEAEEDLQRQAGVVPLQEAYLEAGFATLWRKRVVWLAFLFVASLGTFYAMAGFEDAISKLVVLTLFVPLCISVGGNSGSQAATLVTRAMALGQIEVADWFRVLRHELVLGVMLGVSLGVFGMVRGMTTSETLRGDQRTLSAGFVVRAPADAELARDDRGRVLLPAGVVQAVEETTERSAAVELPPDAEPTREPGDRPSEVVYRFPAGCTVSMAPVERWRLGLVIALAVAGICLWGTVIGAMLPLLFKRVGADPAVASSPFVATFVDVTGIVIYFSIAKVYLL